MKILAFTLLPLVSAQVLPKPAPADTDWESLRSQLSDPSILTIRNDEDFVKACVTPFQTFPAGYDGSYPYVSNYILNILEDSRNVFCIDHLSCAFADACVFLDFPNFPVDVSPFGLLGSQGAVTPDEPQIVPAVGVEPRTAGDIVASIKFAAANDIGITVKVAGHSYMGASTAKDTLLLKLSTNYPKYATLAGVIECSDVPKGTDMDSMACQVAMSRGKNAVMRTGGGELFDEAYRAVSFTHMNSGPLSNETVLPKYHLVGGGAGTVSAAGGWLASGGLSGTTGMRMYGMGIDQVVHIEAVLPSGEHVRFGPTAWEEPAGDASNSTFPIVTEVTGFCNANPIASDETEWDWVTCDTDINFEDLWFAFRGGGGGTYGVLTSLHYQLHDYPGAVGYVYKNSGLLLEFEGWDQTSGYVFIRTFLDYLFRFLFLPETIGVSEEDSRACNSAQTFGVNPFEPSDGPLFCYGESATTIAAKWSETVASNAGELVGAGIPEDLVSRLATEFLGPVSYARSYSHSTVSDGVTNQFVPAGRIMDSPPGSVIPMLGSHPYYADSFHTHFPLETIEKNLYELIDIMIEEMFVEGTPHSLYLLGGAIPESDDGVNSLSPNRRTTAFQKSVPSVEMRSRYYELFYGDLDPATDEFPGSSCHNHALYYEMGPQKNDWTKACPIDISQFEREQLCVDKNLAAWGTVNLARLESIKEQVDPNNLFICASGVGYSNPAIEEEKETDAPVTTATEAPVSVPEATEAPVATPVAAPVEEAAPTTSASSAIMGFSLVSTLIASLG